MLRRCCLALTPGVSLLALSLALVGCGGGGPAGSVGSPGGGTKTGADSTARFHVDVATGKVTIFPNGMPPATRAIFAGTAVGFNSTVLLDVPGSTGLKTLGVALVNNWAHSVGVSPDSSTTGLKVLLANFANVSAFSDLRPKTKVFTLAGSNVAGAANGSLLSATFNGPTGIASAGNGTFYVTDTGGNLIRKIAGGSVTTLAGSGTAGSLNGQGSAAQFNSPFGIAVNPVDGALIVTDLFSNLVRRVTPDGRVTTVAGIGVATSTDGSGSSATLNGPAGVFVDSTGTIYVSEFSGNRIRKIVQSGNPTLSSSYTVYTLAGSGALGGADGTGTAASFNHPTGLAFSTADGSLYIVDQLSNAVRRLTAGGEVVTIAGTGTAGSTDGPGNTATFNSPRGIVYVNGALVVADRTGNRLRQLTLTSGASPSNASSWNVATLAGNGSAGTGNGNGDVANIPQPQLIAADRSGNLYVPDVNNDIREVIPSSGYFPIGVPTGFAPSEPVTLSNPDGTAVTAGTGGNAPYLSYAEQIAAGATSTVHNWNFLVPAGVTAFEFTAIVEANSSAETPPESTFNNGSANTFVRTLAGNDGQSGFIDGVGISARFSISGTAVSVDHLGDAFVVDFSNSSIRRVSISGVVSTVAGIALTGGGTSIDGSGVVARFDRPGGLAVTSDGATVYIADSGNNKIRRAALTPGADPTSPASWTVTTIAGTGQFGPQGGLGSVSHMSFPFGIAIDPSGNLYFSEHSGNRIRRMTFVGIDPSAASNWLVTNIAGDTAHLIGTAGEIDGQGAAATFSLPTGIVCDRTGTVYVAEQGNGRIRKVTPDGAVTTLAGSTDGYQDGLGPAAQFSGPSGIACDAAGYLYVADTGNNRIRAVSPTGNVTTIGGNGVAGGVDGLGTIATFNQPFGIAIDQSGTLYAVGSNCTLRLIQRIIGTDP